MVAVVFMVPVTFMQRPSLLVVIIVRVVPNRTGVGRPAPKSRHPQISSSDRVPISIDPSVARTGQRRAHLIA
jgi:hypothetical protein